MFEDDWGAEPLFEGKEREKLVNIKFGKNFFLFLSKFIQKEPIFKSFDTFVPFVEGISFVECGFKRGRDIHGYL